MLKDSFCSSPWFHLRINYNGDFDECRWFEETQWSDGTKSNNNVATQSIMEFYNSERMCGLRNSLLNGNKPKSCETCYYEDRFDKLNGRKRQLLKSGIILNEFELTTRASPHYDNFVYSNNNQGVANHRPTDLQINLGNTCNSACIMCRPTASSRLEQEYKKLHKISPILFDPPQHTRSWTQDETTLRKVVDEITTIPGLRYIHFLGGETLYDDAFYAICEALIKSGQAKEIIIGTTTNGTLYDTRIANLIREFKEFHLGISIETVSTLNDYIRYPGKIHEIQANIDKFLQLRTQTKLYISLRITPNVFTISEIDQLFEYMIEKNVIAESCNILYKPECLRIELMPQDIRQRILLKLDALIDKYNITKKDVLNIRNENSIADVIKDVVLDYRNFIRDYTLLENTEDLRKQLVEFLKSFEQLRNNSILDHAPEYTDFLRAYGY